MTFTSGQILTAAQLNDFETDSLVVDTTVLVVDKTNDRVGIGTASPAEELHIQKDQDGDITQILVENIDQRLRIGSYYEIGVGQYAKIQSENDAGTDQALVLNPEGGNVGIGTTSPAEELHILKDQDGDLTQMMIENIDQRLRVGAYYEGGVGQYGKIQSETDDGTNIALALNPEGGNVGIGTTTPQQRLDVAGDSPTLRLTDTDTFLSDNELSSAIEFFSSDSSGTGVAAQIHADGDGSTGNLQLRFGTGSPGGASDRMTIDSLGNVGIGNTAPAYVLDTDSTVISTARFRSSAAETQIAVPNTSTNGRDYRIISGGSGGAFAGGKFGIYDPAGGVRFIIDAIGNTGIGTNSPTATLDINGSLSKNSGSFKIPHPLPAMAETHNLVHSFVEAPRADLIYRGRVTLTDGAATVDLDDAAGMTDGTFELLNRDLQCYVVNNDGWTAVRGTASGSTLTIEAQDASCDDTIDWLVVGERQDQHMYDTEWTDDDGRVIVEPLLPPEPEPATESETELESESEPEEAA